MHRQSPIFSVLGTEISLVITSVPSQVLQGQPNEFPLWLMQPHFILFSSKVGLLIFKNRKNLNLPFRGKCFYFFDLIDSISNSGLNASLMSISNIHLALSRIGINNILCRNSQIQTLSDLVLWSAIHPNTFFAQIGDQFWAWVRFNCVIWFDIW